MSSAFHQQGHSAGLDNGLTLPKEIAMDDETSCGKGLADHSVLPAKVAELIDAVAHNLELHMTALDLQDPNSREEHEAYARLATQHRNIAAQLHTLARQMASYRDLPRGRHDQQAMSEPRFYKAFEVLVQREHELQGLLQHKLDQHRQLLAAMRGTGGSAG
jgi:hypothetical protein